jgi:phytoene dehydrogenase-like protein
MKATYDAIVIGAGHNGLVAAGYLARNGLSVLVLERSDRIGGACITKEIIKGFRVSAAAQVLGMLRPQIVQDLELHRHGLRFKPREPEAFIPFPDGKYFFTYAQGERTAASLARIAPQDGEAYARYDEYTTRIARILHRYMLQPAPGISEFASAFEGPDGPDMMQCVLFASLTDYLDRFFVTDYAKGPMAYHGLSGSAAGPMTPGTAFSKFYHSTGELTPNYGAWTFAQGGMGSVTQALANAVRAFGGEILLQSEVQQIAVIDGRASSVVLTDGREIRADYVLSNADPKRTFLGLLPKDAIADSLRGRIGRLRTQGSGFKINFAISELPDFAALPGRTLGPQHCGGIIIAPSITYLEQAWDEAKYGRSSSAPFTQFVIQSATDPTLAPEGRHTVSLWGHHFPYQLATGDLDAERERLGDRVTDLLTEYAPNFRGSVLAREIYVPADLERVYGITGGQIFHTELMPDQVLWGRPAPGITGQGDVVRGLYLSGAGAHPGGDVHGAPGYNAAQAVLKQIAARQLGAGGSDRKYWPE